MKKGKEKKQRKGGKRNRKWGRNKAFCLIYKNEDRRLKNKVAKLKRHINSHPYDNQAVDAFMHLTGEKGITKVA